jgi:hypothetical protein
MSKSNASAKSRRAFIDPNKTQNSIQSSINNSNTQNTPQAGLTLQQVIAVIDKRLLNVESFVKESKENKKVSFEDNLEENNNNNKNFDEIISEFNSRFELLAEEINNIKDIIIKLQSFTMDVNKALIEERMHVLSDIGTINNDNTYNISDNNDNTDNNESDNNNDTNDNDTNN